MKIEFQKINKFLSENQKKDIKVVVRKPYVDEKICRGGEWRPKEVLINPYCRISYFTTGTKQIKHSHPEEMEIYNVLKGSLEIELEGKMIKLEERDSLIISPGKEHFVVDKGDYLVQVITVGNKGKIM